METKNKKKKELLKKIMKAKKIGAPAPSLKGASPFPMDGGLGKLSQTPSGDAITGGAGSNLGTNGVF